MKLKIASLEVEADTLEDIKLLLALALETLPQIPQASPRPSLAIPGAVSGDRERELRDAYKERYGKGFSMKGRSGSPLAVLESLESAGWPVAGEAGEADGLDGPPATQQDDGEAFV